MQSFDNVLFAARAGAEWAWRRIYEELAPPVAGYLRAHGAPEADDLTAEVFLHVVRGLDAFTGGERAFRGWVFTIAHARLVDDRRRRARRPVTPADPHDVAAAAGEGGDVGEEAVSALDDARVRELIDGLPADQRAVLLLRIVGDLTIEQIAAVLGKRPGAVKALQRRALRRMEGTYARFDREGVPLSGSRAV